MKKSKFLPTILGVAALASSVALPYNTFATSKTAEVKITIPESLSLTLSDNAINFDLSDTAFHSDSLTVTGATNSARGYTISFGTNNDYNDLRHSNILVEDKIESVTEDKTEANFPATAWGVSTDTETFKQVPMAATNIFSTKNKGENDHTLTVGAKAAAGMVAGDYSNELMFTIVANPELILTISDITNMQQMTSGICAASTENESKQLIDVRDNKSYWVTKLADGNCWMTQNLDLDLSTTTTLTPADSDVQENWTPSHATIAGAANLNATNWLNNENNPYSFDPGNYYFDGTYYSSLECIYLTTTCEHFATTPYDLNGEHGHVGNYYNWSAAVASNDTSTTTAAGADMNSSICPKGWRLPHGYQSIQGNDFETLNTTYGGATDSDFIILANPLFFVRGGEVGALSPSTTYEGEYWSSTANSARYADSFRFNSSDIHTTLNIFRGRGLSVRCLAR